VRFSPDHVYQSCKAVCSNGLKQVDQSLWAFCSAKNTFLNYEKYTPLKKTNFACISQNVYLFN